MQLERRIYGIETEYGVTCTFNGRRRLSPDEVARYLFRRVVSWGRSSNVFLANGSRLYLDVGSHPEYATAECDSIGEVVAHDRAGELILEELLIAAEERLAEEGIKGDVHLFKNNTDSAGNSYGCHENYLTVRSDEMSHYAEVLIPFLITRQIFAGAGKVLQTSRGARFVVSQRAEHIWEGVSSATTRSRPIINTRDEPHADAESYRRLHVIVGDSNMSEYTTYLKVASMAVVLRMVEDQRIELGDFTLENPIRAIREISHDLDLKRPVKLASGTTATALEIQRELLDSALDYAEANDLPEDEKLGLQMWSETLEALEVNNLRALEAKIDWVIKKNLIESYMSKNDVDLDHANVALLDLQYHSIQRSKSVFFSLERAGMAQRMVDSEAVISAMEVPPQNTRAKLRGDFIRKAKEKKRDFTVDWVHLKLNDQAQRTVLCKDPFKSQDSRVEKLIEEL